MLFDVNFLPGLSPLLLVLNRNGRLRSQWSVTFPESGGGKAELTGVIKVQVSTKIGCTVGQSTGQN